MSRDGINAFALIKISYLMIKVRLESLLKNSKRTRSDIKIQNIGRIESIESIESMESIYSNESIGSISIFQS